MSKIKELKNSEDNLLNVVDILELFSFEKKSKYTDLLLKLMKATPNLKEHSKEVIATLSKEFPDIDKKEWEKFNDIQLLWIYKFIDSFFNFADLKKFSKFCEYNERGLIEMKDVTAYKNFDTLIHQLELAENKIIEKELEKQVIKVYEDDEWSLVRPLTFNASKKYGSRTKWCTTQENYPDHFNKYSRRGVLVYCIAKQKLYKTAAFYSLDKSEPEFSWWDEKDNRIDAFQTQLPDKLLMLVRDICLDPNAKSNEQLNTFDGGNLKKPKKVLLSGRIENAVERASEIMQEEPSVEMQEPSIANMNGLYTVTRTETANYDGPVQHE